MINQRRAGGLVAPYRIEGNISGHENRTAGIFHLACSVSLGIPAEENLALRCSQSIAGKYLCQLVLCISIGISNRSGTAVRVIGYSIALTVVDLSIKHNISCDPRIDIERLRAGYIICPTVEAVTFMQSDLGNLFRNACVVGNVIITRYFFAVSHKLDVADGRSPFCVNGDVVCGHNLTCKIARRGKRLIKIPTLKDIIRRDTIRSIRRILSRLADISLILIFHAIYRMVTVIHINNIIAVAGIVELGAIPLIFILFLFQEWIFD